MDKKEIKEPKDISNNIDKNGQDSDSVSSYETLKNMTPAELRDLTDSDISDIFFYDGNKLLTGSNAKSNIATGYNNLLALFSDGTFLVSETHRFDGRVFSFKSLMKKEGFDIKDPIYITMRVLTSIYKQETRETGLKQKTFGFKNQMQKEYVNIISKAASLGVSDVHVVVSDNTQVFFRIDGVMETVLEYDGTWGESFVRSVFASADISDSNYSQNEFQAGQKMGDIPLKGEQDLYLPSNVLAIRLQFNPIAFGSQYLVMRLLYANTKAVDILSDLKNSGFTSYEVDLFYKLRSVPTGMVIVSGPTGSGKSTTLSKNMNIMLKERNYETNLITVEDPPEYPIMGARQMPVTNTENEMEKEEAFVKALSAALRSDPDTMMVGEIRSLSAAELTFKGALSGHNVWSTLHANSAAAVILRLLDMGIDAFKLKDPDLMRGLMAQRLFKVLCNNCKKHLKNHPDLPVYERVQKSLGDVGLNQVFLKGDGCEQCGFKGITGRTAVAEIIMTDEAFLELMVENKRQEALTYWINNKNGKTLKEAAIEKLLLGTISVDEVERWCGFIDENELIKEVVI